MAIGNVVGSNIFNILSVLGITAVVFPVSRGDIGNADLAKFLGSALVLLRFITTGSRMDRWEGAVLFVGFCAYLGWRLA
jgi:cation:H+ antiporter